MTLEGMPGRAIALTPARIAALLLGAVLAAWSCTAIGSFRLPLAALELLVAGGQLVAIGRASASLLGLKRPEVLPAAHDALLGQVLCLGYVIARSFASDTLGLPGISSAEVFAVEASLFALAWGRAPRRTVSFEAPRSSALLLHALWLGWLFAIALHKLDLYFTPSSDPDIHAYYAKVFLERGRVYYDLLPASDAWMVYPSAFGMLNFVWGRLSGLHPVQLVNMAPYVQLTLFAGATFSLLAGPERRRAQLPGLALLHFGFAYVGFNAVFAQHRAFLEGTPRLAHSALLIFPLWFAAQHRDALVRRPLLFVVPALATAAGACVNPTHVPAALLVAAFSLALAWPRHARARARWGACAAVLGVALVTLWTDPFYRGLARQQTAAPETRDAATDLTGAAFAPSIDLASIAGEAVPEAARRLGGSFTASISERLARRLALAAFVLLLGVWFARVRGRRATPAYVRFACAAFASVALHGVWVASTPFLARPGVLQTRLLIRYSRALQEQMELLFLALVPLLVFALALDIFERSAQPAHTTRAKTAGVALAVIAIASLPYLILRFEDQRTGFYAHLRESPLGTVDRSDADLARELESIVGREERVLLPGRLRRMPGEYWIFTTGAGRAIPLFSDVRTSFFLGLDGWAFTAGAYEAHVEPPHFDPDWLRAQGTVWLVDGGSFPRRLLNEYYESVLRGERAVLWRLKEADRERAP